MGFCIEWRSDFKYLNEIKEFNIDYKPDKGRELQKFLDKYKNYKINIRLPKSIDKSDIKLLTVFYEARYNFSLICDISQTDFVKDSKIPYFYSNPAWDWEDFYLFLDNGSSEIFVAGNLGFNLKNLREMLRKLDKRNIKLRCYANLSSFKHNGGEGGFKGFFIRPENIDLYFRYIDSIEFYDSIKEQNTLFDIYKHDKKWYGELREIIKHLTCDIDNHLIVSEEAIETRLNCNRKCLKNGRCYLCNRVLELAETLKNNPNYDVFERS